VFLAVFREAVVDPFQVQRALATRVDRSANHCKRNTEIESVSRKWFVVRQRYEIKSIVNIVCCLSTGSMQYYNKPYRTVLRTTVVVYTSFVRARKSDMRCAPRGAVKVQKNNDLGVGHNISVALRTHALINIIIYIILRLFPSLFVTVYRLIVQRRYVQRTQQVRVQVRIP
jgi:hypothetical protein